MDIVIDCERGYKGIKRGHLKMGGESKYGDRIDVTNLYLEYNGKPWIPIMGEFHYSRYPEEYWEFEILKIKASGINIISSYMIWIHHEEEKGEYNFKGDRDIRRFIELCKKHEMKFIARIGPWVHAEVRNGGFPDWLIKECSIAKDRSYKGEDYYTHTMYKGERYVRANREPYLSYVRKIYERYYKEMEGLFFKDGGPIIGIQLENELVDDKEHIRRLKEIAIEIGYDVPIYTVTGWSWDGIADFPEGEVIPLFGGYPEAPWEQNTDAFEIKPSHYFFTKGRNDGTIGNDQIRGEKIGLKEDILEDYLYASCEIGPGVQNTHHRRPNIRAKDLYSISVVMLGKGNNLPGYYVYHGGRNPSGKLGLYSETRDTYYPNDCPIKSYDFQAPIGEYGFIRESYKYYKLLHMFINSYGEDIAVTQVRYPDIVPIGAKDKETPRVVGRIDERGSGYLFINTNNRNYEVEGIEELRVIFKMKEGEIEFPRRGIYIPEKVSCIFPINQDIEGLRIRYATAQMITQIEDGECLSIFYCGIDGIGVEFAIEGIEEGDILRKRGEVKKEGGITYISNIANSLDVGIEIDYRGKRYKIFVISFYEALKMYKMEIEGKERILISSGNLIQDAEKNIYVYGESIEDKFRVKVYPNVESKYSTGEKEGEFNIMDIELEDRGIDINIERKENRIKGDNKYAKYLFSKVEDCPEYDMEIDKDIFKDGSYDYKVMLDCECDVLQIYDKEELVWDYFHSGGIIEIGLRRYKEIIEREGRLRIKMSPYSKDKEIFSERKIERDYVGIKVLKVERSHIEKIF